ncbi:MAG: ribonuclease R, partial [Pseudomonadota bacterium]
MLAHTIPPQVRQVLRDPAGFAWRTLRAFRANQGLLLAGAVAYYALLSIVPLL